MDLAPSVYEHAARLIGRRPWEVSRDADLMLEGHAAAYRLYEHRPAVVGIDIYSLEAEAYGAPVRDPGGNGLPAVAQHPCASIGAVLSLPHFDPLRSGRLPMVIKVSGRLAEAAHTPERGGLSPVTKPAHLLGGEHEVCCTQGLAQVRDAASASDGDDGERLVHEPGEGHLVGRHAQLRCEADGAC